MHAHRQQQGGTARSGPNGRKLPTFEPGVSKIEFAMDHRSFATHLVSCGTLRDHELLQSLEAYEATVKLAVAHFVRLDHNGDVKVWGGKKNASPQLVVELVRNFRAAGSP